MQKHERLEEDTKQALSHIISYEIKNPDVDGLISVTRVSITPDQKYAKIFVSIYNTKSKHRVVKALEKSTSFIKSQLAKSVKFRNIPSLTFSLDESIEYGDHINKIIAQINSEK